MPKRRLKKMLRPVIEFIEFRVLHIDDSPERIARGVFTGIMIAYTPLLGLHLLVGLLAAFLFNVNKFATLSFVWISNVFTLIPIYYPAYIVGRKLVNFVHPTPYVSRQELLNCFKTILGDMASNNLFTREFWHSFVELFGRIGLELFIGGFFIGLPVAAVGYYLTFQIITRHRKKTHNIKKNAIPAAI